MTNEDEGCQPRPAPYALRAPERPDVVHRKMKRIAILFITVILVGCATHPPRDPFTQIPDGKVSAILVGNLVCDTLEYNSKKARFETYFRINDPVTVAQLTELMRQEKSEPDFPLIGILSYQRFVEAGGRPVAETHIVNFNNTVGGCNILSVNSV